MIHIFLVSDTPGKLKLFDEKNLNQIFRVVPTKGYRGIIENTKESSFFYFDLSSFSDRQKTLLYKYLSQMDIHEYGIIDPQGEITDVASLFHSGASDYIGKKMKDTLLAPSRIEDALFFYRNPDTDEERSVFADHTWEEIRPGNEYPFIMMFIEIDILPQWKTKSDRNLIVKVMNSFYSHVANVFSPLQGKLWIKTDYGGLFLFPRNKTNMKIIEESVRLIINRVLISSEIYDYGTLMTYRISIDSGLTEYQPTGKTGTLISESINYIFHLGQRFTPKGNLIITQELMDIVPEGLKDFFIEEAEFQGRKVFRLLQPLF